MNKNVRDMNGNVQDDIVIYFVDDDKITSHFQTKGGLGYFAFTQNRRLSLESKARRVTRFETPG